MKQAKNIAEWATILWLALLVPGHAATDPKVLLENLRSAQSRLDVDLRGRLREENGTVIPFELNLAGPEVTYKFFDPEEQLVLHLTDDNSTLTAKTARGAQAITGAKLMQSVRGSDITYEDLALRFIYWQNARAEGEDEIKTISCSIVLVQPSTANSEYGSVRLWIAGNGSGLLKAEGFDRRGKLLKRFTVVSGQRINDHWMLKQMRIEKFDAASGKPVSRTYLEMDPVKS